MGEEKRKKEIFQAQNEMSLPVSRVRDLKELAHNCRQGRVVVG